MSLHVRTHVAGVCALLVISALAVPSPAQFQNPITAAKDAYKKAKEQQQQQQQQQKPPAQQTNPGAGTTPAAGTTPTTPATTTASADTQAAAPWTPPAEEAAAPVKLVYSKMPDVVGIRLGMPAAEALAAMHKQYPADTYQKMTVDWWPSAQKPDYGYTVLSSANQFEIDGMISFTAPPGPQVVWHLTRSAYHMNINHETLLAALRAKYGKETVAMTNSNYKVATDDSAIAELYWLYNEQGERIPLPPSTAFPSRGYIDECSTAEGIDGPAMPVDDQDDGPLPPIKGWCRTMVSLHVSISIQAIVQNTITRMVDMPLAYRTAHAAKVWQQNLAEEQRKKEIEKSKTVTPSL
jgi:hypothetical protein